MNSVRILGCRVDPLSRSQTVDRIASLTQTGQFHQIITANTLMLLEAGSDPLLREIINSSSVSVPESSGMMWAGRHHGQPFPEKVPGIDLFQALCSWAAEHQKSIYLLGAKPGVADAAADALKRQFPNLIVAGTHHGYFRDNEAPVLTSIRKAAPAFLFVAMTVPGQEKWIHAHAAQLGPVVAMGVGGSFDVLSGNLQRAPEWMQNAGIEWLYRLIQEPWRWRRIAQLPVFVWKVLQSRA